MQDMTWTRKIKPKVRRFTFFGCVTYREHVLLYLLLPMCYRLIYTLIQMSCFSMLAHHELRKFVYLFGVLRRFQHCTDHITMGSWKSRGNQYIEFVRVLYCKLPTNGKQLPAFPLEAVPGTEPRPQRWEERVLPLCHRGPLNYVKEIN